MKNPARDLRIFEVEINKGNRTRIVVGYVGRLGNVYAFHGYSDSVLAKAGGHGYDKTSCALAMAVEKLSGRDLATNGAAGINSVIAEAAKDRITIKEVI